MAQTQARPAHASRRAPFSGHVSRTANSTRRAAARVARPKPAAAAGAAAGGNHARQAWDAFTDRLVAGSSLPFSILVLPQVLQNVANLSSGNAGALSIISWEVGWSDASYPLLGGRSNRDLSALPMQELPGFRATTWLCFFCQCGVSCRAVASSAAACTSQVPSRTAPSLHATCPDRFYCWLRLTAKPCPMLPLPAGLPQRPDGQHPHVHPLRQPRRTQCG